MAFKTPKLKSPKIKLPKAKSNARIKASYGSKKGYSIEAKGLSAKQAKSLMKNQSKYEIKRSAAGILSQDAMTHKENMAKIKADMIKKVNATSQATGSATALAGTAIATRSDPQVQINGGMSQATQGRPQQPTLKPSDPSKPQDGENSGKDWAEIIEGLG